MASGRGLWGNDDLVMVFAGGEGRAESEVAATIGDLGLGDRVVRPGRVGPADRDGLIALAAAVGATLPGAPVFDLPDGDRPAEQLPAEPFVLLHPFSRGKDKSLSPDAVAAFCRAVDRPVVLVGRSEEKLADLPPNVTNLLNKTSLTELLWGLRHAVFVVSVDSGPMHLAALSGAPTIGLFVDLPGMDPERWGPLGPRATAILAPREACVRCERGAPVCPCMAAIEVRQVAGALQDVVGGQ
jgi:ADP-heptose:LPS heptosyltransferase